MRWPCLVILEQDPENAAETAKRALCRTVSFAVITSWGDEVLERRSRVFSHALSLGCP